MEAALATAGIAFSPQLLDHPDLAAMLEPMLPAFPQDEAQMQVTVEQWDADLAHDTLDRLGGITAPTLVVVGEQDLLTPPWQAKQGRRRRPRRAVRAAHRPGVEPRAAPRAPDDLVRLMTGFLADKPIASSRDDTAPPSAHDCTSRTAKGRAAARPRGSGQSEVPRRLTCRSRQLTRAAGPGPAGPAHGRGPPLTVRAASGTGHVEPVATICITGSTDGIGLDAARTLLEQGHRVLVHARNESAAGPWSTRSPAT